MRRIQCDGFWGSRETLLGSQAELRLGRENLQWKLGGKQLPLRDQTHSACEILEQHKIGPSALFRLRQGSWDIDATTEVCVGAASREVNPLTLEATAQGSHVTTGEVTVTFHSQVKQLPARRTQSCLFFPDHICLSNAPCYQLQGDCLTARQLDSFQERHLNPGSQEVGAQALSNRVRDPRLGIPWDTMEQSIAISLRPEHLLSFPRNVCQGDRSAEKSYPEGLFSKELF